MNAHGNRYQMMGGTKRSALGFTLLELMIVLVVAAILVSIAIPSYNDYTERARRADGQALLLDAAARQERYFYSNNTYTTDLTLLGYAASPAVSEEGHYQVSAAAGPNGIAAGYELTAAPQGPQASDDCGGLTLDSTGSKGHNGSGSRCWGD